MNNGLLVFLSSGAGAALVGFALSSWNLRKQNKAGGEMVISKQITEALLEIQSFERQLRILELASSEKIENIFNGEAKYIPAIFLTKENLFKFQNELSSVLRKQEQFLDIETVAYLNAMEKYLGKLMVSFPGITESDLQELGYLLFDDIKRWQSELDQHLIKQINKFSYKLTSLYGKKWDRARNNAIEKYLINSKLMEIVSMV
ncbi:hypothetical protein ACFC3A_04430 [Enterococcus thailandicus]|uniref:hypothetical protein n=1 Tax=Enterococcus thailandicus TaxID=417368 RepID=UPI0039A5FB33